MRIAIRLGATAAAFATVGMFAGLASAQQAAPAAAAATPTIPGPGGKQVPDLNGIWGGNLVAGGTSQVGNGNVCPKAPPVLDAFNQAANPRFAYQGRTGSQQWVTFEQEQHPREQGRGDPPDPGTGLRASPGRATGHRSGTA